MNYRLLTFLLFQSLILIFHNPDISANDSIRNTISIRFGTSNLHLLDEHATFLIFRGTGIAPAIDYNRLSPEGQHYIRGVFYFDNLKSSSSNFKTEIKGGQFRYAYLKNLQTGNDILSAGLSLSSLYLKTDYYFYTQAAWLKAIESWYWSHTVDIAAIVYKEWARNKLTFQVFIPVISNVSRPEYSSSGDYNYEKNDWDVKTFGKTVFLTKNKGINAQLDYSRILSRHIHLNVEYEFYFYQNKSNELIRFYMNNFRLGLTYSF